MLTNNLTLPITLYVSVIVIKYYSRLHKYINMYTNKDNYNKYNLKKNMIIISILYLITIICIWLSYTTLSLISLSILIFKYSDDDNGVV